MIYSVRKYITSDFEMLKKWMSFHFFNPLTEDLVPKDSTYILLNGQDQPVLSAGIFFFQGVNSCMIENVIANPFIENREGALEILFEFLYEIARNKGVTHIAIFSHIDKIKKRYEDCGMTRTLDNVSFFAKNL